MQSLRCRWHAVAVALVVLVVASHAIAASLQVAPTSLSLSAERRADGLLLRNTGSLPLHAQVRVFRWRQDSGEDRLEPTGDLAISPPMLELPPGGEQLVRVVRLPAPPDAIEASYRVIVDELPMEQPAQPPQKGLHFVLRYSIPVFLMPRGGTPSPALHAHLAGDAQSRYIELENLGNGHAQIADLQFIGADGRKTQIAAGLSGYVLPGQRMRWSLPAGAGTMESGESGSLRARINGEADERALEFDR